MTGSFDDKVVELQFKKHQSYPVDNTKVEVPTFAIASSTVPVTSSWNSTGFLGIGPFSDETKEYNFMWNL